MGPRERRELTGLLQTYRRNRGPVEGEGCAHSSNGAGTLTPGQGATAQQLSAKAQQGNEALDFDSCADGFKAAAEVETDAAKRAESFYRAAGCASLAGHLDAAVTMVKRAVQSGYFNAAHLQYNAELVALPPNHGSPSRRGTASAFVRPVQARSHRSTRRWQSVLIRARRSRLRTAVVCLKARSPGVLRRARRGRGLKLVSTA